MSLARKVKTLINEMLNMRTMSTIQVKDMLPTIQFTYFINVVNKTKFVVFFESDSKIKIIEVDCKDDISRMRKILFQQNINDSLRSFEKMYQAFYQELGKKVGAPPDVMLKKYGTGKIKKDYGLFTLKQFLEWTVKQGILFANITTYFPHLSGKITLDNLDSKNVGNFQLIGYEEKYKEIISVIDKTELLLGKTGFEKVGYGKVLLVGKLSSNDNALADYAMVDDSMRVFPEGLKGNLIQNPVQAFIHELGHRYYYRFTSTEGRKQIAIRFNQEVERSRNAVTKFNAQALKVGDRFTVPVHGELEYQGYIKVPNKKNKYGEMFARVKDGVAQKVWVNPFDSKAQADIYFSQLLSTEDKEHKNSNWLPTPYSRTSPTEWFAEVFSYAIVEGDKEIMKWVKGL